jgi:hypothetical protein
MRRVALTTVTLLALVAVSAAASHTVRTVESHTFDEKTTETKSFTLPAGGGGRGHFRIAGRVKTGEIRLVVRDEAGNSHLSGVVSPDGTKPGEFDLQTGESRITGAWIAEVELKDATGHYEFTWTVD